MSKPNLVYAASGDFEFTSREATPKELQAARDVALRLHGEKKTRMRSCWDCNAAHTRFLTRDFDYLFTCFHCGTWFCNNVDVTEHEEETDVAS